jgi:two-component system LytT family response regulator
MSATPVRTVIVDDEPLARRGIRARLSAPEFDIVGECGGGREAIESIRALAPDLVFLDVQMPEVDGFAVAEAIGAPRMPIVIFVTAFDAYALRAFDAHAVDYLLKPIDDARFADMLGRVRERMRERAGGVYASRLAVRDRGRVVLLDPREVEWVAADGDYVRIIACARSYLMRETLTAMAKRLPPPRFARIHRSTIVNVEHVRELVPLSNREFQVVMRSGVRLRASRTYDDALSELIETRSTHGGAQGRGVR